MTSFGDFGDLGDFGDWTTAGNQCSVGVLAPDPIRNAITLAVPDPRLLAVQGSRHGPGDARRVRLLLRDAV